MTDQTEWRSGLPAPDYERINQKVFNVIVHHTAGSNSDTNYTDVVRNIYVYHTQIRLWSDIGYNYLIAQNGTIFKGRDPGEYEQDNVMGAHFCNNNAGTMGISMMGTYTDIVPTDTALGSLISLATWKLGKEGIDPLGKHAHPLNTELPSIAGHRDGCSTECPGNALYPLLDTIRNKVLTLFNACGYTVNTAQTISDNLHKLFIRTLGNQVELDPGNSSIEFVRLYDLTGRQVYFKDFKNEPGEAILKMNFIPKGIFIIICKTSNAYYSEKILFME
jgi:hypothetical protein